MKSSKFRLLSTTVTPLAAAAALAVGMAAPAAAAGSGCSYGQKTAALPEAKAHDGEIILAMSHGKKAECAANPCAAAEKAKEAANPCAAVDKATDEAKDAMKSATPCKPKTQ